RGGPAGGQEPAEEGLAHPPAPDQGQRHGHAGRVGGQVGGAACGGRDADRPEEPPGQLPYFPEREGRSAPRAGPKANIPSGGGGDKAVPGGTGTAENPRKTGIFRL